MVVSLLSVRVIMPGCQEYKFFICPGPSLEAAQPSSPLRPQGYSSPQPRGQQPKRPPSHPAGQAPRDPSALAGPPAPGPLAL